MGGIVGLDFSALARKDLLDIARYIARDNPQRARGFVIDLREQCVLLSKQPGLGVARTDLAENLRMLPYGRYLIFFPRLNAASWLSACFIVQEIFPRY